MDFRWSKTAGDITVIWIIGNSAEQNNHRTNAIPLKMKFLNAVTS